MHYIARWVLLFNLAAPSGKTSQAKQFASALADGETTMQNQQTQIV